jgi:hypothetical protein
MTSRRFAEEGPGGGQRSHGIRRGIAQQFRDVWMEEPIAGGADVEAPIDGSGPGPVFDEGDVDRD